MIKNLICPRCILALTALCRPQAGIRAGKCIYEQLRRETYRELVITPERSFRLTALRQTTPMSVAVLEVATLAVLDRISIRWVVDGMPWSAPSPRSIYGSGRGMTILYPSMSRTLAPLSIPTTGVYLMRASPILAAILTLTLENSI